MTKAVAFHDSVYSKTADITDEYSRYVNETFDAAAAIVNPLLESVCLSPPKECSPRQNLTFIGVAEDELPWVSE